MIYPITAVIKIKDLKSYKNWGVVQEKPFTKVTKNNSYISLYSEFGYPDVIYQVTDSTVTLKYKYTDELDSISFIFQENRLVITPDPFSAIVIYYFLTNGILYLANELEALLGLIPQSFLPGFNIESINTFLHCEYGSFESLLLNINILFEDKSLVLNSEGSLNFKNIPTVFDTDEKQLQSIEEISTNLDLRIKHIINKYYLGINTDLIGCTLSGGDDSALTCYWISKFLTKKLKTYTIELPYNVSQFKRITTFNNFIGSIGYSVDLSDFRLASRAYSQVMPCVFDPYLEIYYEPTVAIAKRMQEDNIKLHFMGGGGDELFIKETTVPREIPNFLNNNMFKSFRTKTVGQKVSNSIRWGNIAYNTIFHRHGIWVASPFVHKEFISFVLALPDDLYDRYLVYKNYQLSNGFPVSQLNYLQKDSFKLVGYKALVNYCNNHLHDLLNDSQLSNLNFINVDKFMEKIKNMTLEKNYISHIYKVIFLELFLQQYLKYKGR